MKKIILSIFIISLFMFSPILSANPINDNQTIKKITTDIPENHLIENVPYVSQLPAHCFFACLEMIYRYYGLEDIDQSELSTLQGQAYSLLYQPSFEAKTQRPFIKPSYKYYFQPSIFSNQGNKDIEFVANLLGFKVENHYPENYNNHIENWNVYWNKLKRKISNNTPIITCIDCNIWPLFLEQNNFSLLFSIFVRGSHSIVVVGYNESNQTVCVHDPYPGQKNAPKRGTYYWVPLSLFKRAVRRSHWDVVFSNYDMYIFNKVKDPLSKDAIFEKCHERNIEKIKGNKTAYDEEFYRNNFEKFGIDAWKQIKNDFEKYFIRFLPIYRLLNGFTWMPFDMISAYSFEATSIKEVADYLNETSKSLENETLKDICKYDAEMFYNETIKLEELTSLTIDLKDAVENNTIFKAYFKSIQIIDDICNKIDEIIAIEEVIIAGPVEE